MPVDWVVFGEVIIGRVQADNKDQASVLAHQTFGQTHAVRRVQSVVSYEIGLDEQRAAVQRRRPAA